MHIQSITSGAALAGILAASSVAAFAVPADYPNVVLVARQPDFKQGAKAVGQSLKTVGKDYVSGVKYGFSKREAGKVGNAVLKGAGIAAKDLGTYQGAVVGGFVGHKRDAAPKFNLSPSARKGASAGLGALDGFQIAPPPPQRRAVASLLEDADALAALLARRKVTNAQVQQGIKTVGNTMGKVDRAALGAILRRRAAEADPEAAAEADPEAEAEADPEAEAAEFEFDFDLDLE